MHRRNHRLRFVPQVLVLFTVAATLPVLLPRVSNAQEAQVAPIPADALAYVVVPNLERASGRIDQVAQTMQLPSPRLLPMAKQVLGLGVGLDDDGPSALVLLEGPQGLPVVVGFVATDDFEKLVAALNGGEPTDDGLRLVDMGDRPLLVGRRGTFAVFASPDHRAELKQVLAAETVRPDPAQVAFSNESDLYAVATTRGVKMLSQQAVVALQQVKAQFAQQGPEGQTVIAGLTLYEELFKWAAEKVNTVVVKARVDQDSNLMLTKRVSFREPGELTEVPSRARLSSLLNDLPDWPYVMSFAGEMGDPKTFEPFIEMSLNMTKAMAGGAVDERQLEKLMDVSRKSMEGLEGMAFVMGVPDEGGSIYSRMAMIMKVKDSSKYIDNYLKVMEQMKEVLGDDAKLPYRVLASEELRIGDTRGMKIVMQIAPELFAQGDERVIEMFEQLYGTKGELAVYAAPIDANRVALAYVSLDNLKMIMRLARNEDEARPGSELRNVTANLLPDDAQVVAFASPQGWLQFTKSIIEAVVPPGEGAPTIPAFPDSPPLGFAMRHDAAAIEAGMVAPGAFLKHLGDYIRTIQQANAQ